MQKITSGTSLNNVIRKLFEDATRSALDKATSIEKSKQDAAASMVSEEEDVFDTEDASTKSSKTQDAETEKLASGKVTADDIVDKLNTIRGGKSFKDEVISARLSEYVDSLSTAEKTALLAFLKGLSQIVTGEVLAQDAADPQDPPAKVDMKKGPNTQTKSIKPNVIKGPKKTDNTKPSAEDTSAPVPITPKK